MKEAYVWQLLEPWWRQGGLQDDSQLCFPSSGLHLRWILPLSTSSYQPGAGEPGKRISLKYTAEQGAVGSGLERTPAGNWHSTFKFSPHQSQQICPNPKALINGRCCFSVTFCHIVPFKQHGFKTRYVSVYHVLPFSPGSVLI